MLTDAKAIELNSYGIAKIVFVRKRSSRTYQNCSALMFLRLKQIVSICIFITF